MHIPMIWVPRTKIIEAKESIIMPTGLSGRMRLQTYGPDGRPRRDSGWFKNLITDNGLDAIGRGNFCDTWLVGTGNATPQVTDTGLVNQVATATSVVDSASASNQTADSYHYRSYTRRFSPPGVNHNLQEAGIRLNSSNGLFSRALILDGGGSPTTFPWDADEALDMTYELRAYPPLTDTTSTMTVAGEEYDITIRAAEVGSWSFDSGPGFDSGFAFGTTTAWAYNGTIGAITGVPSGTAAAANSKSNTAYSNGSYVRDCQAVWGLTSGNLAGGITAFLLLFGTYSSTGGAQLGGMRFQIGIDGGENIPKTGSVNLSMNFRQSWGRRAL